MNHLLFTIVLLTFSYLGKSQTLGYSFAYSIPYSKTSDNEFLDIVYSKESEYSVGLTLNNHVKQINGITLRLSTYTTSLEDNRSFAIGGAHTYVKFQKYWMELESYSFSYSIKEDIFIDIGAKWSYLLRSNRDGFIRSNGVEFDLANSEIGKASKFKWDLLLRLHYSGIRIVKGLYFIPSYSFGYALSNEFKFNVMKSKSLTHRFEVSFVKNIGAKKDI